MLPTAIEVTWLEASILFPECDIYWDIQVASEGWSPDCLRIHTYNEFMHVEGSILALSKSSESRKTCLFAAAPNCYKHSWTEKPKPGDVNCRCRIWLQQKWMPWETEGLKAVVAEIPKLRAGIDYQSLNARTPPIQQIPRTPSSKRR